MLMTTCLCVAALFFSTYELSKRQLAASSTLMHLAGPTCQTPLVHMLAASCGEAMGCLVRVPTEIVKQRLQTGITLSAMSTVREILATDGPMGMYRGYCTMLAREVGERRRLERGGDCVRCVILCFLFSWT